MAFIKIPTGPDKETIINIDYIVRVDAETEQSVTILLNQSRGNQTIITPISLNNIETLIYNAQHS